MKIQTILLIVITMAIGALGGTIFTNAKKDLATENQTITPNLPVNYLQKIMDLEAILDKDPNNHNALVQLGHNYFDSNQPNKAIQTYAKALTIDGNDPNVLTDQGIMYRRVGKFDNAIDNFEKANKLDPNHVQSLYNLGIVYRDDLVNSIKAKEAWTRYLVISPIGEKADQVRTMIEHMENGH